MKMHQKTVNSDLKNTVLTKISTSEVKMRPRIFFIGQLIGLIIVGVSLLITIALLTSFIVFSIQMSDRFFLIDFGARGIKTFLFLFPWPLFFAAIILLILFIVLFRNYRFAYRTPMIYVSCGALIVSIIVGGIIHTTSFHNQLLRRAQMRQLPFVGGLYEQIRHPSEHRDIVRGRIINISFPLITIQNEENELILVRLPMSTANHKQLKVGDWVFVAGDLVDNELRAYGVRKFTFQPSM